LNALRKDVSGKKSEIDDLKKKYRVIDGKISKVSATIKFIGRFDHKKNADLVLKKLEHLKNKNIPMAKLGCKIKFIHKENKFVGLDECKAIGDKLKDKKKK